MIDTVSMRIDESLRKIQTIRSELYDTIKELEHAQKTLQNRTKTKGDE